MRGVGCGMRNEGDYTIPLWVFDIEKQALYNSVVRFWAFYLTVVALNWHFVVEISEKYSFRRESFQHQCWVLSDFSTAFNSPLWGERKSVILLFSPPADRKTAQSNSAVARSFNGCVARGEAVWRPAVRWCVSRVAVVRCECCEWCVAVRGEGERV